MNISPARLAAFDVLLRIESERAYSSILLPHYEEKLSENDRSLCHELTLGTLRRQILLDKIIDLYSNGKKLDVAVRVALRLGAYQLRFLDRIPEYSSVNESVNLVQKARKTSAKGFVNAVLRRIAAEKPVLTYTSETDRLSVETSHPKWLIDKWIGEFGFAQAAKLAEANNRVSKHAFRLLGNALEDNFNAHPSEFVDGCFLTDRIVPEMIAAAKGGTLYFQDEGSQMIAASITIPKGGRFLDVCAAPGGKTGLVSRRNQANLNLTVAGDIHWQRVVTLRDNCIKQRVENLNVTHYDATQPLPFAAESFDAVLVDAPCSGTGTIRHNPELRYFLEPSDIDELSAKQLTILINASKMVKRAGRLIYSTCSLETEENEAVCEKFLSQNVDFQLVRPAVNDRFITDRGFARTFPHRDNMDGFFIAEFRSLK